MSLLLNTATVGALTKAAKVFDKPGSPSVEASDSLTVHKRYQYMQLESFPKMKVPVSYYLKKVPSSKNLIIFFHGFLSDEKVFEMPDMWATDGWLYTRAKLKDMPSYLSISFGWCWLLNPANVERTLYPQYLKTHIVAEILQKLFNEHGLIDKDLYLCGSSMGGFNALQFYLDYAEDFKKAIFHVPMTPLGDPFSFNIFSSEFWKMLSAPVIRGHFTKESWPLSNPHLRVLEAPSEGAPPVMFQVSKKDEFNLYQGGKALYESFKTEGFDATLVENEGKHKDFNPSAAAQFLDI